MSALERISAKMEAQGKGYLSLDTSSSNVSASQYITISPYYEMPDGSMESGKSLKVRISDHDLPPSYGASDLDYLVGPTFDDWGLIVMNICHFIGIPFTDRFAWENFVKKTAPRIEVGSEKSIGSYAINVADLYNWALKVSDAGGKMNIDKFYEKLQQQINTKYEKTVAEIIEDVEKWNKKLLFLESAEGKAQSAAEIAERQAKEAEKIEAKKSEEDARKEKELAAKAMLNNLLEGTVQVDSLPSEKTIDGQLYIRRKLWYRDGKINGVDYASSPYADLQNKGYYIYQKAKTGELATGIFAPQLYQANI